MACEEQRAYLAAGERREPVRISLVHEMKRAKRTYPTLASLERRVDTGCNQPRAGNDLAGQVAV